MVVVTIELWPKGKQEKSQPLGVVVITNDQTGSNTNGNYNVMLTHSGKYFGKPGIYKSGKVKNFRRTLSPYCLVFEALKSVL